MNERQAKILCHLVHQYIAAAEPISSRAIGRKIGLPISEATIRTILHRLDEEGFLIQPHTSAGRIPTDTGYRYYVDSYRQTPLPKSASQNLRRRYQAESRRAPNPPSRVAARLLSQESGNLAITVWLDRGEIQDAGLAELLAYLAADGSENTVIREVAQLLKNIDSNLPLLASQLKNLECEIIIGRENPYFNFTSLSMLAKYTTDADGQPVILMLVGPRRIPYHYHRNLLQCFADIIQNYQ